MENINVTNNINNISDGPTIIILILLLIFTFLSTFFEFNQ
jgi:hypothetical protein